MRGRNAQHNTRGTFYVRRTGTMLHVLRSFQLTHYCAQRGRYPPTGTTSTRNMIESFMGTSYQNGVPLCSELFLFYPCWSPTGPKIKAKMSEFLLRFDVAKLHLFQPSYPPDGYAGTPTRPAHR